MIAQCNPVNYQPDQTILYRFWPNTVVREDLKARRGLRLHLGSGRRLLSIRRPVRNDAVASDIVVRAHIQPVLPVDVKPEWIHTRVTLFVNGTDCGSR
jgi:hypothetical protein